MIIIIIILNNNIYFFMNIGLFAITPDVMTLMHKLSTGGPYDQYVNRYTQVDTHTQTNTYTHNTHIYKIIHTIYNMHPNIFNF